MDLVKFEDCRPITVEEAILILCDNPSGFVERYDFKSNTTTRHPGVFIRLDYCEYMDQVRVGDEDGEEYYAASDLLKLLRTKQLYTQTDKYLSVVKKGE